MAAAQPAPAPRKQVNMAEIMQPGILLAIAGLMARIAGAGGQSFQISMVIISLVMLYSAIVSFGYIAILRDLFPVLGVSAVSGVVLFFYNIECIARYSSHHWSVIVGFIAGLIALFAAFVGYFKPSFAKK